MSVAGCKIELFDKDNYQAYASTAPSWMANIIKEYGGNPYARLVEMGKQAQMSGVIKGILLHQGESNTGDKKWPEKVKGVYDDLIKDLDLYLYKKEGDEWVIVEKNWEKVRDGIVASMTNFGYPYLVVDNGDYRGNRELYIKHMYEGQELDMNYAEKTLQHVYTLWGRPVHLETLYEGKRVLLTYDGERNSKSSLEK